MLLLFYNPKIIFCILLYWAKNLENQCRFWHCSSLEHKAITKKSPKLSKLKIFSPLFYTITYKSLLKESPSRSLRKIFAFLVVQIKVKQISVSVFTRSVCGIKNKKVFILIKNHFKKTGYDIMVRLYFLVYFAM